MTDFDAGRQAYAAGMPPQESANEAQLRGWLDAANRAWLAQNMPTVADHDALCAELADAVQMARTGKRILCVGRVGSSGELLLKE